ncbi:MAG: hypothetical protein HY898_11440 [Deltaproteobacteria bacterium]|nr:hypothetical protein [Deltaproteobacteria bacterium]
MRVVHTRPPSFPTVRADALLQPKAAQVWQVVCGDAEHWRAGVYSPAMTSKEQIEELERHDCPELFLLLQGRLTLLIADSGGVRELELKQGEPVLVSSPHSGFCPDGPHTGSAFVVERDSFDTEYRKVGEWTTRGA